MIRQNELMNVRCSERGSLLGIKIYSPSSECLIECVDIPEHFILKGPFRQFHCTKNQLIFLAFKGTIGDINVLVH